MNPHQRNKIDINSLSTEEQRAFRMFGRLPNKKDLLQNKLKERKYFDSGDYALSKAGKASDAGVTQIGSQHPNPENIPHLTSPNNGNGVGNGHVGPGGHTMQSGSPVKESSFLHRETSINDQGEEVITNDDGNSRTEAEKPDASVSPPPVREGVPIRQ
ncbi:MAG: hypothetical protein M1823_000593 [Watsoniomyces obsoletus]|nr:MAG: hypothetical protein M1823_000593 [Watsoniomyces obsoletus]